MILPSPTRFGSILVADHLKSNKRDEAVGERNYASGILDRYAGWTDGFAQVGRARETNVISFRQVCAATDVIDNCWTDNAPELVKAAEALGYRHHPATDNRPQPNGVA